MSELHLKKGSLQPQKVDDKLRLYSMRYCAFAHRVRLVLSIKNVPHDIVNVDIFNKPEWFFNISPSGQVPVLDTGTEKITDSLKICEYLDKQYPEPRLHSKYETEVAQDQKLLEYFNQIVTGFYNMLKTRSDKSYDEHMKILLPLVMKYEIELQNRGTLYFGGDVPRLIDYMMWPFTERSVLCGKVYKEKIPGAEVFPLLYSWCSAMRLLPEVQQTKTNIQNEELIFEKFRNGDFNIDFDVSNNN